MQYSTKLPTAVHILLAIAVFDNDHKVTSDLLASSVNVNPVIIRNMLGKLKAAGLVTVNAGVGGAHLAKDPSVITLLDVFDAVEERESLFHFHENPDPACPVGRNIRAVLGGRLDAVTEVMREQLASVTLRSLTEELDLMSSQE